MRRFLSFNDFFNEYYGGKTVKLSLDGGFSCPNRDGTLSEIGCIFCSDDGSGEFAGSKYLSLDEQIESQKEFLKNKWKAENYIAYFQNFTNTYGSLESLREIYDKIADRDDIKGISIATRCDCLDDEKIEYLKEISKKKTLWLELGMQTVSEDTIKVINRGYSHKIFDETVKKLQDANILFLIHAIFGLPFEDEKDFVNTINYIRDLAPFGVKFHNLYILKDSPIYELYKNKNFKILSRDEYVDLVLKALDTIGEKTVVHRITGDPPKTKLFEPTWCADKLSVISEIDKKLKENNKKVVSQDDIKKIVGYWKNIDRAF
ncbi:coproporphyrinogen III oxidase [Peptoniphilus harei]|uniref:TIGR01212 family radical SAM protein n=1 Tax=Peptoniphilus harei TaxID=54005 RepID=UPI000F70199D|nr:TIGR01212 family radical SAM protein [Peptoniphilus harei]MDU6098655.1 TIGR01212 family radical SAM protein [Peptoniphilus harei]QQE47402.1 TIGR01212 family radical SAM protein [Peptoniphilus harei]VEJ34033.1 coproporphyrinogen III oxidase [Peptoniphilus harei]